MERDQYKLLVQQASEGVVQDAMDILEQTGVSRTLVRKLRYASLMETDPDAMLANETDLARVMDDKTVLGQIDNTLNASHTRKRALEQKLLDTEAGQEAKRTASVDILKQLTNLFSSTDSAIRNFSNALGGNDATSLLEQIKSAYKYASTTVGTGDTDERIALNAKFTRIVSDYAKIYPDQQSTTQQIQQIIKQLSGGI
jgi:hypothetical protein